MATPTVTTPQPNQALGQFVQVLNGLQTVSVAVTGTTRATFSVSDFTVTLTGTNLAASGGQLTGGTITSIKFVEASPATTLVLSGLALSVASVNAAVAAEQAGDSFALDRLLGNLDWTIRGSAGDDGSSGSSVITGDNTWYGGAGVDALTGGSGRDSLYGGADGDVLYGGTGTVGDVLDGDGGNDVLFGEDGNDTLYGDAGDDILLGGLGQDRLYGGTGGADDFIYTAAGESGPGTAQRDLIGGFGKGVDDIVLSAIDANTTTAFSNDAFVLDAGGAFATGEIRQRVVNGNLVIDMNTDADPAAEMAIVLLGQTALLTAADFSL